MTTAWTDHVATREVIECRCGAVVVFVDDGRGRARLVELGGERVHDEVACAKREAGRRGT